VIRPQRKLRLRARQHGLSMIEMLVALGVGVVLMLVVTAIALSSSRSQSELSKMSRQVDNGRYALQLLSREIELAGFYGELINLPPAPATLPSPCVTSTASLLDGLALPIQSYDNSAPGLIPACITGAGYVAGTDVLIIRRAETEPVAAMASDEIYLRARSNDFALGTSGDIPATTDWNTFPIRRWRTDIYFIGQDADAMAVPELRLLELRDGAINGPITLVDGIEDLQFDFGVDRSGDGAPNATDTRPAYVASADLDELQDVVTVRVHLLARNAEPTPDYVDDKVYRLGLTTAGLPHEVSFAEAADANLRRFKRHVYSATVRAVNRSGRRE
jgi:type IV pilus assembly protein PilW